MVVEAFTTGEATLRAAAELGRQAIACVPSHPLVRHILVRLGAALPKEKLTGLAMRPCRPDQMVRGLSDRLGEVSLVVAEPPRYEIGGRAAQDVTNGRCPACEVSAGMLTDERLAGFLAASWRVLRPGGHLAVITTARYENGRLVNPSPRIVQRASALGFRYVQHVIALRVPVEGDVLVVQAGPEGMGQLRDVRSRAVPPAARVHADVCLFTKPGARPGRDGGR
ncbi:hypothetical protein [Actinomadura craniellae]|uniref:hypothetical protein n=1 Tax=Actinomadura craniellae TaxID=2231787 RepID=UPI0013143572|nr:hypothetical protein [Actinomadura craniellae]